MKIRLLYLFSILLISISSFDGKSQTGFDKKKKNNGGVNTSSLHAKQLNGSKNPSSRYITPSFNRPILKNSAENGVQSNSKKSILYSSQTGLPEFIQTPRADAPSLKSTSQPVSTLCYNYLDELKSDLRISDPENQFSILNSNQDIFLKTHIRLDQVYKGIKIHGAQVMVHLDRAGRGELFNGHYVLISNDVNIVPSITSDAALNFAEKHLKGIQPSFVPSNNLLGKEEPFSELMIYKTDNPVSKYILAYHITFFSSTLRKWEYFVDAHSGNVVHYLENTCFIDGAKTASAKDLGNVTRSVNTYQKGSNYYMLDASRSMYKAASSEIPDNPVGAILTIDMKNTYGDNQGIWHIMTNNNVWNNPTAISAHYNAGIAYEFYRTRHGRNSIDGNGGTIISIINVPDNDNGNNLDNAFWNGQFMCYGNGDVEFYPLAGALDVAGHEMTHGVIQSTANLEYDGESGAINESLADVFGIMMDVDKDWTIAEDVVKLSTFPSGALRSFQDPHNGGTSLADAGYQPKYLSEKYTGEQDNHGVHVNSGITNYAFYLFATGIGDKDDAENIYYKALTDYLTKSSQFIDLRRAVIQAATDLHGEGSNQVNQAKAAFDAVGITDGQPTEVFSALPENPGTEYVLIYNVASGDNNTFYRSNIGLTDVVPLTQTTSVSRPSVTDDGSWAVFVAGDHTIHGIYTAPGHNPDEWTVQDEAIWSNAVVSKDGNKIAAVTNDSTDASIWVYDFKSEVWEQFMLYNPTYTEGVEAAGPLYADALEFNYTGEFLVYDAFNRLDNNTGGNIEYWDVNFIHVWDNEINDFADGNIEKLFSNLPEGVSIGNPSFSKNSPYIIAFDYIDESAGTYSIVGCNIETNLVNEIYTNNYIGWPSYSKNDSRIAFTTINKDYEYQTQYVTLHGDKISSDGTSDGIFRNTEWPVYYATGVRKLTSTPEKYLEDLRLQTYPNPFTDEINIIIPEKLSGDGYIEVYNQTGQLVYSKGYSNAGEIFNVNLSDLNAGYYLIKIKNVNSVATGKILKLK